MRPPWEGTGYPANFFSRAALTTFGTKAETSPPIAAIWRTRLAAMCLVSGRRSQKNRLDLGGKRSIHARHLHFMIEVAGIAEPANDNRGTSLPRSIDCQPVISGHVER
jgi:hypothetical protein